MFKFSRILLRIVEHLKFAIPIKTKKNRNFNADDAMSTDSIDKA